jgi:predicted cobalt transporter CbtA
MELTYARVITRALIVGLIAGVLTGAYLLLVVEPTIDRAIAIEEAAASNHSTSNHSTSNHSTLNHHAEEPLFTRTEQAGGGFVASVVFGAAIAFVFGTVYAACRHRLSGATDFRRVLLLATVAFATTALLPALKYPASPPGVGNPDTVDERTLQYLALIAFGIVAAVVVAKLSAQLRERLTEPARFIVLAIVVVVLYGGALVLFPDSPDRIPARLPAQLIWDFRIQSLGGLALVWTALGLGLGWSIDRLAARAEAAPGAAPARV